MPGKAVGEMRVRLPLGPEGCNGAVRELRCGCFGAGASRVKPRRGGFDGEASMRNCGGFRCGGGGCSGAGCGEECHRPPSYVRGASTSWPENVRWPKIAVRIAGGMRELGGEGVSGPPDLAGRRLARRPECGGPPPAAGRHGVPAHGRMRPFRGGCGDGVPGIPVPADPAARGRPSRALSAAGAAGPRAPVREPARCRARSPVARSPMARPPTARPPAPRRPVTPDSPAMPGAAPRTAPSPPSVRPECRPPPRGRRPSPAPGPRSRRSTAGGR